MIITTASRLPWEPIVLVGVLIDGIEVAVAPEETAARACAAELRARPAVAAEIRDEPRDAADDRRAVVR